jgi:phosphoribosylanthranilate isomerase
MLMRVKIKICGIKTPDMAQFCADAGADYIGIVVHPASPRYVDIDTAVLIAQAAKKAKIIPVGVFVDQDADAILSFCKLMQIDHVQLHGDNAKQAMPYLPANICTILVIPAQARFHNNANYLLFDSPEPGSGQVIDWTKINPPQNIPFFLAGGLNANNVQQAIALVKPYAVDVSSGVESSRGEKSKSMILDFIKQVQHAE